LKFFEERERKRCLIFFFLVRLVKEGSAREQMRASLFFSFTSCHSRFFLVREERRRGLSRAVPTRPSTSDIRNRESTRPRQGLIGGSRVRERGTGERERDLPACVFFFCLVSSSTALDRPIASPSLSLVPPLCSPIPQPYLPLGRRAGA
jgi:hypothetical protein